MLDHLTATLRSFAGDSDGSARLVRASTAFDLAIAGSALVLVHAAVAHSGLGAVVVRWANQHGVWNIEQVSFGLAVVMLGAAWYAVLRCRASWSARVT